MNAPLDVLVTPITGGTLTVVAADGVVVASGYDDDVVARIPAAYQDRGTRDVTRIAGVSDAIEAYEAGDIGALDAVPVDQPGGEFFQAAWRAMREIPPGETWSYAELAAKLGKPKAVRAAGSACARNNVAPFVPCHRILRSDGSLGGYAYGLPVKRALLDHEGCSTS
jgi:methylated-DNA-[protein]-cysteine S-methyltransferase